MKLTLVFLFFAFVIAFYAVVEAVKNLFEDEELAKAVAEHEMTYAWLGPNYAALR